MYHGLPLVVVGSSPPNVSVANNRFEGLALPKLKRLYGHYIVVTVYKDGFCVGVYNALGKNNGITGGGINFGSLHPRGEEVVSPVFSRAYHVGFVLALRTDAGDAE